MEAKRLRVDVKSFSYDDVMGLLNSSVTSEICDGLLILKKKIISRTDAVHFMDKHRTCFLALLKLFDRLHTTLLSSTVELEDEMKMALRESSSVLANVCHFSVTACAEVSQWPRIAILLLNLLEHQAGGRMKANVLRLIGNLCNFNETSALVAHNSGLLEAIALNIKQSDPVIVDRSIRVMRLLARNTIRLKSVILSNCAFHIGSRIVRIKSSEEVKRNKDILQILLSLVRVYPKDVGRQLAGSGCAQILLEILLGDDRTNNEPIKKTKEQEMLDYLWQSFLLKLTRHSFDIREAFGRDAINRVLSSNNLDSVRCEFLCHFTQDAWARAVMSEKKVLARMLDLLNAEECSPRQQMKIIASLKHFIYDTQSMAYLCQRGGFLRIAISYIRRFVDENSIDCAQGHLNAAKKPAESSESTANKESNKLTKNLKKSAAKLKSSNQAGAAHLAASSKATSLEQNEIDLIAQEFFCGALARTPASPGNLRTQTVLNRSAWSPSMSPNNNFYEPPVAVFPLGTAPSVTLERTIEQDERYLLDDSTAIAAASLLDNINSDDEVADDEISRDSADSTSVSSSLAEWKVDEKSLTNLQINGKNDLDLRTKRLVVTDCLEIISKLTHQEENYPYLVKEELLRTLIDYVSETSVHDERVMRSIIRLSRCEQSLQVLLEMNFHIMVIKKLIRRKCILTRFGDFCSRCDRCREFGCDMIRDFARHADSNMGWYHIKMGLHNENANVVRNALITGLTMIHGERTQRFYPIYMPMEMLLLDLARMLGAESSENIKEPPKRVPITQDASSESTEKRDCCDIIMAFSSLLTRRTLRNFPDLNIRFGVPNNDEKRYSLYEVDPKTRDQTKTPKCECILNILMLSIKERRSQKLENNQHSKDEEEKKDTEKEEGKIETLEFYNSNNVEKGPILVVPKEKLCTSNPYFQGMFDHEFVEKVEGRFKFMFNESEDQCDEADFVKFMHYLVGCRDSDCVAVETPETCAALLQLSDKYLCSSFMSELIKPTGLAQTMIKGDTLRHFLRPILTIPTVANSLTNTWIFALLRYSTDDQLLEIFDYFKADALAKTWLLETLQHFLLTCINSKADCQFLMPIVSLWDI